TRNGRDSNPKYRGIKLYGGEVARPGCIIIRQCGTKFKAGYLVRKGKDHTLYSVAEGTVRYRGRFVDIMPSDPDVPRYTAVEKQAGAA
ncbi:MAG: 50S ribosomal protein L27, partial [Planctomycetota bacterium]|nr:50S ribosomal protein L27 [Planctomycetota bacterium]